MVVATVDTTACGLRLVLLYFCAFDFQHDSVVALALGSHAVVGAISFRSLRGTERNKPLIVPLRRAVPQLYLSTSPGML